NVTFTLGDSSLPDAPVEGGSFTVSSVGSAVKAACERLRGKLIRRARGSRGSWSGGQLLAAVRGSRLATMEGTARGKQTVKRERGARGQARAVFPLCALGNLRGGPGGRRLRHRPRHPRGQRGRGRPDRQSEDGAEPDPGWDRLGIGMALEEESLLDHRLGRFM